MSDAEPIPSTPRAQGDAPIHCAECRKYNERDAVTCGSCGAHLWVKCAKCRAKNTRTASRCSKCHQRMRSRSFVLPRWNRPFRNRKKKRLLRAFGWLLLVGLAGWLVYRSLPEPHVPPANTAAPSF